MAVSGSTSATLVAPVGTPVHAVEAGTVSVRPGRPPAVRTEAGLTFEYGGMSASRVTVANGERVAAGAILGTIGGAISGGDPATAQWPSVVLAITDDSGDLVDAVTFLIGATDPNELGHATIGHGGEVDPFTLDEDIAAASPYEGISP